MNNNFISSLVNEQTTVGQYLAAAEARLNELKIENLSGELKNIQNTFSEIVELEKASKEKMNIIYQKRDQLYSNLITTMIANFYCRKISEKIADYQTRLEASNYIGSNATVLDEVLTDMNASLTAYSASLSSNLNNSFSVNGSITNISNVIDKIKTDTVDENTPLPDPKTETPGKIIKKKNSNGLDIFYTVNEKNEWEEVDPLNIITDSNGNITGIDPSKSSKNNYSPLALSDSVAASFQNQLGKIKDIFDQIKEPLGFPEAECTENGLKGLENVYSVSGSSLMSGTIKFYKKTQDGMKELKLESTENIFNGKIASSNTNDESGKMAEGTVYYEKNDEKFPLFANVSLRTKKDYMLEDGSSENPYIISSYSDAISKGLFTDHTDLEEYFVLANDISVQFSPTYDGTLYLNKTIKPNGHTISCGVLISKVYFGGQLKEGTLNITMKGKMGPRPLFFPLTYAYYNVNVEFGNDCSLDDDASMNFYTTLLGTSFLAGSVYKVEVNGRSLKKRFNVEEDEGGSGETTTSKINFFYTNSNITDAMGINWKFKKDPLYGNKLSDKDVKHITIGTGSSPVKKGKDDISNIGIAKDTEVSFSGPVSFDRSLNRYVITSDNESATSSSIRFLQSSKGGSSILYANFSKVIYEETNAEEGTSKTFRLFGKEKNRLCRRLSETNLREEELDPALQALADMGELNKLGNDLPALQNKNNNNSDGDNQSPIPKFSKSVPSIDDLPKKLSNDTWMDKDGNILDNNSELIPKIGETFGIGSDNDSVTDVYQYNGSEWVKITPEMTSGNETKDSNNNMTASNRIELINSYLNTISSLKNTLNSLSISLEEQEAKAAREMYSSIESYKHIESLRKSDDPCHNYDYSEDLSGEFDKASGYIGQIMLDGDTVATSINYLSIFNNINATVVSLQNLIDNLILELIPSIIKLNDVIDNKCVLFTTYFDYDTSLTKSVKITDESIKKLANSSTIELGFSPITIGGVRGFSGNWLDYMTKVCADGDHGLLQLYIAYEYCLNLMTKADVNNNTQTAVLFKRLINDILLRLYKKRLIENEYLKKDIIYDTEKRLQNEYGLYVTSDAQYEPISSRLTKLIPDLKNFEFLDIQPILNSVISNSNNKIEKIKNYIDLILIEYLTNNITSGKDVYDRMSDLNDVFSEVDNCFKVLYIRYRFSKLLEKIYSDSSNNTNHILNEYQNSIKEIIDDTLESQINDYISVWTFKYYTEFKTVELITPFIFNSTEISEFLRNADYVDSQENKLAKVTENMIAKLSPEIWNRLASLII